MKNLYRLLGIKKDATAEEIKKAFRDKVMKEHPDRGNHGDPAARKRFDDVKLAYAVLGDAKRRQRYDETGEYDSTSPDNSWAEVVGILPGLYKLVIQETMEAGIRPKHKDIADRMRTKVKEHLRELKKELEGLEEIHLQIKETLERFTVEGDEANPFDYIIQEQLNHVKKQMDATVKETKLVERALEYLKKVKYRRDNPYGSSSTSSSSGGWFNATC